MSSANLLISLFIPGVDRERLEVSQGVLFLDDSRIRYLDGTFCEVDWEKKMTCYLPGAGVQDVVERYRRVVEGTGKEALVVVHVGMNDVGRVWSEKLVDRYRASEGDKGEW